MYQSRPWQRETKNPELSQLWGSCVCWAGHWWLWLCFNVIRDQQWGLACTTPGPSQLQSSQGDEEGCVPLPRAVGSCPAWETRDWESAEVSICWLQHAFLVVHGSGGRKERDDKNKAADLYLAINHSRVIFFFFDSIWRLCNKWACSWIFYFIPLQLWWSSQVAVAFP